MLAEMGVRVWPPRATAPQPPPQADSPPSRPMHEATRVARPPSDTTSGSALARWLVVGSPADLPDRSSHPDLHLLLDRMLQAVGLSRDGDADARAHVATVQSGQSIASLIANVRPSVVLILGRSLASSLLRTELPLGQLRGQDYQVANTPAVVTYPPAYLIRQPERKRETWADLCRAMEMSEERAISDQVVK